MTTDRPGRPKTRDQAGRFTSHSSLPGSLAEERENSPRIPGSIPPERRNPSTETEYQDTNPQPSTSQLPVTPPPSSPTQPPPNPQSLFLHRMTTAPPAKSVKLNVGQLEFRGEKPRFRAWKEEVDLYMIGNPEQFPTDQKKVAFCLSYITGSNTARLWRSSKQRAYEAGTWPTWTEFERQMEQEFGDPAAEQKAKEFLLTYKQGNLPARKYFSTLELWFSLAKITDTALQWDIAKKGMNPQLRSSLTIAGFPNTYQKLKEKMTDLEDEDEKMDPKTNARSIDSRLADPGAPSYRRTPAAPATFRVQGHVPARQRPTVAQILRMPKGQRPPPGSACYRCRDLGL